MDISNLKELFAKCNKEGIQSYSELILGRSKKHMIPGQTDCVLIIEAGQHGAIESWLLQLLENAELNTPNNVNYMDPKTVVAQGYVSGSGAEDEILENAELVVGTRYTSLEQLAQGWMYSWMINNFLCFGWTQVYTFSKHTRECPHRIMYDRPITFYKAGHGISKQAIISTQDNIRHYSQKQAWALTNLMDIHYYGMPQEFLKTDSEILNFVDSVYTKEFLQIDKDLWFALRNYLLTCIYN